LIDPRPQMWGVGSQHLMSEMMARNTSVDI
jgi:hypothetical protein